MLDELKKSIGCILYERLTSPLAGTFFLTWFVWNWRIPYFLIFSDSSMKLIDRITFVEANYLSIKRLFWLPAGYTALILVLYPFLSLGSFFIWAEFKFLKNKIRNFVEKNELLSITESMELKVKHEQLLNEFVGSISSKDREIDALKLKLSEFENVKKTSSKGNISKQIKKDKWEQDFFNFKSQQKYAKYFDEVSKFINTGRFFSTDFIPVDIQNYYIGNEIIEKTNSPGVFSFTEKGNYFQKQMTSF